MTKNLDTLRSEIDAIDDKIVELLNQRMTVTDKVGEWKKINNVPTYQGNREANLIERLKEKSKNVILRDLIPEIYRAILSASKASQKLHTAENLRFSKIGIVGLGLIGGSIAKAAKSVDPNIRVSVFQRPDKKNNIDDIIVSRVVSDWESFVNDNDMIIIATPISAVVGTAESIARIKRKAVNKLIVIDVAGVKEEISQKFADFSSDSIEFLPTHPMAGGEKSGYEHAKANLFDNKAWILTPHAKNTSETIQSVRSFVTQLGAQSEILTPTAHDGRVASISHLTFMIASYLIKYIADKRPETIKLAGTGFLSTTRVASGSVQMHTEIYDRNQKNILFELQCFLEYIKSHPLSSDSINEFFISAKYSRDNIK